MIKVGKYDMVDDRYGTIPYYVMTRFEFLSDEMMEQ
jgi:hypothetical protein